MNLALQRKSRENKVNCDMKKTKLMNALGNT